MLDILPSLRGLALGVALALPAGGALAAGKAELDLLHDALGTDELLVIMREEGLQQSEELRDGMFPGRGGDSWGAVVSAIYDVPGLSERFRTEFDAALSGTDVTPLIAFFTSGTGREIVRLELESRRAFMEPDVEAAARAAFRQMDAEGGERVVLLRDLVEVNDLVEYNVTGALNASLAFQRGLAEGEGFEMSEADIVADVWAQETEIRSDTTEWVFAYLAMAYGPLTDEDISAYVELSGTAAGQDLNRALFAGFDAVFDDISHALGRSASRFMVGEEL